MSAGWPAASRKTTPLSSGEHARHVDAVHEVGRRGPRPSSRRCRPRRGRRVCGADAAVACPAGRRSGPPVSRPARRPRRLLRCPRLCCVGSAPVGLACSGSLWVGRPRRVPAPKVERVRDAAVCVPPGASGVVVVCGGDPLRRSGRAWGARVSILAFAGAPNSTGGGGCARYSTGGAPGPSASRTTRVAPAGTSVAAPSRTPRSRHPCPAHR